MVQGNRPVSRPCYYISDVQYFSHQQDSSSGANFFYIWSIGTYVSQVVKLSDCALFCFNGVVTNASVFEIVMPYLLDKQPIEFRLRPILFVDLEFTGLDPHQHEIIEVAALRVSQPDFQITNSYYAKVKPVHTHTADPRAMKKNSYDPKGWSDAISLRQMLLELSDFAPDCLLAGWAVQNEWDFLNASLAAENLPYFYHHHLIEVSTLAFSKLYSNPEVKFLSLNRVSKHLGIYLDNHKPDSDIRATYEIFKRLSDLGK